MKEKFSDVLNDYWRARDRWRDAVWHPTSYDDKKMESISKYYVEMKAKLDEIVAELDNSVHSHLDD